MPRLINAFKQFFDDNGDPLVKGKLKFVESGTNNTDKDTFADINETIKNTNPVILDGAGRCPNIFGTGAYNVISYTSDDAQIQQFDPVSGDTLEGAFSDWNAITIYDEGDIVTGSDGLYYRSISSSNENQNPVSTPGQWEQIKFVGVWNSSVTYDDGDAVYGSDGILYLSQAGANLNNDPITDTINWRNSSIPEWITGASYSKGNLVFGSDGFLYSSNIDANTANDPTTDFVNWNNVASDPVVSGSIYGLTLSNALDADHDITIAAGECADSTNAYNLQLGAALTKQIDAGWVAGDNVGGRFTGTTDVDTWYHLFLIRKDSDGSIDAGFDTSVTAANIPAGYTAYRRIGSVLTDGAANIFGFQQFGNEFIYDSPILDYSNAAPGTARVNVTISTPSGINALAKFNALSYSGNAEVTYFSNPDSTDLVPSTSAAPLGQMGFFHGSGNSEDLNSIEIITNTSSQISFRKTVSSLVRIATTGWIDNRGQY